MPRYPGVERWISIEEPGMRGRVVMHKPSPLRARGGLEEATLAK